MSQAGTTSGGGSGGSGIKILTGDTGSATGSTVLITGAGGITTSASGSTLTITGSGGGGITWNNVTSSTQTMDVQNGYLSNDGATLITFTLPTTAAVATMIAIQGSGTGLWTIAQNAGQTIHWNGVNSTTGVTGSVSSTSQYDSITLICNIANTDWVVYTSSGNLNTI